MCVCLLVKRAQFRKQEAPVAPSEPQASQSVVMSDYVIGQVKSAFVYSQVQTKPKGSHPLLKKWSGKIGTMAPIGPALNWI